jgi:tetratricopeptide (TPR) repeat protein
MAGVVQELARASAMLDVRRYDEATSLLAQLVAAEPESSRAWCLMSRAHLGTARYTDALDAANRAVVLDPGDEWPHRLASNALVHTGRYSEALRAAEQACRLAPHFWQTHVCVAQAALAGYRLDVANAAAGRARALAPNEPDVHFLSGKVSLAGGALASAKEHQERALALDPTHSGAMNELGRIRLRRHDAAGAIRHFISAARSAPDEHIYSRNIDVVILRTVSSAIYVFTLIALLLIWVPAIAHVTRLPFLISLGALALLAAGAFAWLLLQLPREARILVRRTIRTRRVMGALGIAVGGVAIAFGIVAFAPAADITLWFPLAVVITAAARVTARATLRNASPRKPLTGRRGLPGRSLASVADPADPAHDQQDDDQRQHPAESDMKIGGMRAARMDAECYRGDDREDADRDGDDRDHGQPPAAAHSYRGRRGRGNGCLLLRQVGEQHCQVSPRLGLQRLP